jgi:hypothetical protein
VTANLLSRHSETVGIPPESLTLAPGALAAIRLRGGWWFPHIVLTGHRLAALAVVPGEDRGTVRLWIARGDRAAAAALVAAAEHMQQMSFPTPSTP